MIWGGDEDPEDGDDTTEFVSNYSCPNCNDFVLYFHGVEEKHWLTLVQEMPDD